jgi:hypothetical protein
MRWVMSLPNQLYRFTAAVGTLPANMLALIPGRPRSRNLKDC